ncbi:MAG TPA: heme-binding domain-containing protein [Parafilimonas sp.]|nr:heme-binding domain-containing protein [Parafilimonas sp.]
MKKVLLLLIVVLIVIQFFRPEKNIHAQPQPANISSVYPVPANVDSILVKACDDCHSNNTRYPWYNNIQPVAWWLNHHVHEGKEELNFDEFATYTVARKYDKIKEIKKNVDEGEMPLSSYTLIHKDARLTDAEKQALISWSENIRKQMEATYPKDSLERKRGPGPPDGD